MEQMAMEIEAMRVMGAPAVAGALDRAEPPDAIDILHLAELVPVVRQRLGLGGVSDDIILTCLKAIAARSEPRERWRVAFSSRLGEMLSRQGRDLNTALNTLLALLPRPLS